MGGDQGPQPLVKAAIDLVRNREIEIILVGDERLISQSISAHDLSRYSLSICHTPDVLTMNTDPKTAVMSLPNATIFKATSLVKDGGADVVVTTGNTGGAIMACARDLQRLDGIRRGVLAAVFPTARTRGHRQGAGAEATK